MLGESRRKAIRMGESRLVSTSTNRRTAKTGPRYSKAVRVRVRGGFDPDVIEARTGTRLRIVFRREETAPCSAQVVIPRLGKSVMLPPFEDVVVELGPLPSGDYPFSCEFGILKGRILVRGETRQPARR